MKLSRHVARFAVAVLCLLSAAMAIPGRPGPLPEFSARPPGVVINFSSAETQQYLGSPSIAVLPNVTPQGEVVDFIRIHLGDGRAAVIRLAADGRTLTFDLVKDCIDFPGGATKFTNRYKERTNSYWSLVNKQKDPSAGRNRLVLVSSTDARTWQAKKTLLFHPDRRGHAFQCADWLFDGDDVIAVLRTVGDGAHIAHDSNYITFHRFP